MRREEPFISIIIPYGYPSTDFEDAVFSTSHPNCSIEIIVVTTPGIKQSLRGWNFPDLRIIASDKTGRGYFCAIGAQEARGEVLLFLHADTILPEHWCQCIKQVMKQPHIAGGGFSIQFRSANRIIELLPLAYDLFARIFREFWGDRAMFMRRLDLISEIDRVRIPIMEDVEMSRIIRKKGKLVLLSQRVSTSAHHFNLKGNIRHIIEVLIYRSLYEMGVSAERIFGWYYRKSA